MINVVNNIKIDFVYKLCILRTSLFSCSSKTIIKSCWHKKSSNKHPTIRTHSTRISRRQPNKPTFSPRSPPRILYLPHSTSISSYQKHTMIDIGCAVVKYSWVVLGPVRCVDGYWKWSWSYSVHQASTTCHTSYAVDSELASVALACSVLADVWVCGFGW